MDVFDSILEIPRDTGYWLVRADGGKYYEDFFLNNFIAISDNEITLEKIEEHIDESIAGLSIEHYKKIYRETYKGWTSQQIAQSASRTQKFLEDMKIGDVILVPSKKSSHFLIGVVSSSAFEVNESKLVSKIEVNYAINPYFKRRNVIWIKEVSRSEISEKLYWMLSAHQTIFNLKEYKNYINQLLSPIYIHDGYCHGTLKVSKEEGLNSDEWYDFYTLVKKIASKSSDKVVVKSNVQSPGFIEMVTSFIDKPTAMALMTILGGTIFTDVKIGNKTIRGIIPYFLTLKVEKEKMKHEAKQMEVANLKVEKEIEILDEERRSKQLENDLKQIEVERERERREKERLELEAEKIIKQLQISSFDAGRTFEDRTQMDSGDVLSADES